MTKNVVSGISRGFATVPVISTEDYLQRKRAALPPGATTWKAFYSSELKGITTDPACMNLPMDDHMVHRGHAVFDTCNVHEGKAYGLNFHLDRLFRSAEKARIKVSLTKQQYKDIILATIAATGLKNKIFARYWLSVGRGDFNVFPALGNQSEFYVMVHELHGTPSDATNEVLVSENAVPIKPPLLANMKSTNYTLNALTAMYAQDRGGNLGIGVDRDGYLLESSINNVAVLQFNNILRTPPFHNILHGTTLQRVIEMSPMLISNGIIKGFEQGPVHTSELSSCKEIMIFGGGNCRSVVQLDGKPVGAGTVGPAFSAIAKAVRADLNNPQYLDHIPYGNHSKL